MIEKITQFLTTLFLFYILIFFIGLIFPEISSAFDILFSKDFLSLFGILLILSLLSRRDND